MLRVPIIQQLLISKQLFFMASLRQSEILKEGGGVAPWTNLGLEAQAPVKLNFQKKVYL